jgi:hypothetical protein
VLLAAKLAHVLHEVIGGELARLRPRPHDVRLPDQVSTRQQVAVPLVHDRCRLDALLLQLVSNREVARIKAADVAIEHVVKEERWPAIVQQSQ